MSLEGPIEMASRRRCVAGSARCGPVTHLRSRETLSRRLRAADGWCDRLTPVFPMSFRPGSQEVWRDDRDTKHRGE